MAAPMREFRPTTTTTVNHAALPTAARLQRLQAGTWHLLQAETLGVGYGDGQLVLEGVPGGVLGQHELVEAGVRLRQHVRADERARHLQGHHGGAAHGDAVAARGEQQELLLHLVGELPEDAPQIPADSAQPSRQATL